jgi:cysteinyl-tRNA synthetase
MIEWIKKLEAKGFTYIIQDDGVYFDTSKLSTYGELAKLKKDKLKAGARIEVAEGKKNITDFSVWKFSPKDKKRQQEWKSPWGTGFPGWHSECTVMSIKYLGEQFDIHCGGIDHIPIHHTNEIAQTEAVTGKKWVNYWCHGEFLVMKDVKMSKSKGNFITLDDVSEEGYDPLAYRYLCLTSHYKKPLTFSMESVENAEISYFKLKEKVVEFLKDNKKGSSASAYLEEFSDYVSDDLNMPKALAVVWNLIKDKEVGTKEKYDAIIKMDEVLGLNLKNIKVEKKLNKDLQKLIDEREEARKNKDWVKSDELRKELLEKGIIVEDSKEGVKWRYAIPSE